MKNKLIAATFLTILIPLAGELKFYPFHNSFRVSLGVSIYFFFLLWYKDFPKVLSGVLTGASVVVFRIALDCFNSGNNIINVSFTTHASTFFYYTTYSILFYYLIKDKYRGTPFLLGIWCVLIDVSSNIVELIARHLVLGSVINSSQLIEVVGVALIRNFFVIGIFVMFKYREMQIETINKSKENLRLLFFISELYEEKIHLKKTLKDSEHITRECYDIYRSIQHREYTSDEVECIAKEILNIAGKIHEIKKDSQRIYAGISKMIADETNNDYDNIHKIFDILVQANKTYAESQKKYINFKSDISGDFSKLHLYTLLSVLNNLMSNAVEAIDEKGFINLTAEKPIGNSMLTFKVSNSGTVINEKKNDLIFKPGYTTKFDSSGRPSTGIGLTYVKETVESLGGTIALNTNGINETTFIVKISEGAIAEPKKQKPLN